MIFGWGSCSGCDALQGCDSLDDIIDLRNDFARSVVWFDSVEASVRHIFSKDWSTEHVYKSTVDALKSGIVQSFFKGTLPSYLTETDEGIYVV